MRVRPATTADLPDVLNVIDGAALSIDVATVRAAMDAAGALVAVSDDGERVRGANVLDGHHVEAGAVRRKRRGQHIGSTLVEAAIDRRPRLTAAFDEDLRAFYADLGFDVEPTDQPGRWRGEYDPRSGVEG